jgi:multiple sugar transport system ATP-binding protein
MNMLTGVARRQGGDASVQLAAGATVAAPAALDDGREVLYGIRPEHLSLADPSQGLPAEVVVVEPTGADTQVVCRVGGHDVIAVLRDRVACRPGDRVGLRPDAGRAHVFDAASGARLAA